MLHPFSAHQSTGLRDWLESNGGSAMIRFYDPTRADELEAMEAPLLARFEFVPIVRQDLAQTQSGGLRTGWVFFYGWLAPTQKVTFRVRAVCYARPW